MAELMKGMFFERPREGAPEFVKGRLSVKVADAIPFLQEHANEKGYVNCDLLISKDKSKLYLQLNDWKPKTGDTTPAYPTEETDPNAVPF